ncbi:Gfo/Idh/MocA family oxidoreductase [Geodermatophilus sp. DF01-2]|uniref:Gfo/Idh/MocA family oxidoreductase n=1 Tax=Geodermatophilus sp. DF01-2 TaxID=2559610 RepID=UPI001073CEEF|nr:Gfo/Idh/MocA family oxidoreductase [Geodermatophilus sp. DF01_2]TFV64166.1 Gfo/Idh/MocA family oxidoreductase [Geodermatophilus sp. DF01_2]
MARPSIAVVGTGSMGSLHARVLHNSGRADLAVVVEPRQEVGRTVADRFGAAWAPDLDGLSGIDAVIIAAATHAHHGLALQVIDAGLPLLVEKPVADDLAKSQEIVDASEKADLPLMCGLLERYNSAVVTAAQLTREPVHVSAVRHSPYAPRIKTGVAWDLLVHDVDIALRLIGDEPTAVDATLGYFHPASVPGAEDMAESLLSFAGGRMASVSASRIGQQKIRSLRITEVDRAIEVDLLRQSVTIYRHVDAEAATEDGPGYRQQTVIEIPTLVQMGEPLAAQLDRFVDLVEGRVDAAQERASIMPAHRVVGAVVASAPVLV